MDKLAGFRKMNVFFFGNEEEKRAFYLECICPFMEANRKGQYYATRDWNGGPNTEIVYAGEPIDVKALRREIRRYCREKNLSWTPEQIQQNLDAICNTNPLSAEEKEKVFAIRKALGTQFCRRCNYCAPCAAGISIPAAFMMEGYYTRYGLKDWATGRYMALDKKASDCIGCGACEDRCPYDLPIRDMLKKVAQVFGV